MHPHSITRTTINQEKEKKGKGKRKRVNFVRENHKKDKNVRKDHDAYARRKKAGEKGSLFRRQ